MFGLEFGELLSIAAIIVICIYFFWLGVRDYRRRK